MGKSKKKFPEFFWKIVKISYMNNIMGKKNFYYSFSYLYKNKN